MPVSRFTIMSVRVRSLILLLVAACALVWAQDETPLDLSVEADANDDLILKQTLFVSISAEDIYKNEFVRDLAEQQAKQMGAASKRRIERQEKLIDLKQADIQAGKAKPEEMKPLMDEMKRRLDLGYIAIDRANILNDIVRSAKTAELRARRGGGRMERYDGSRPFTPSTLRAIEVAYLRRFGAPMPISADGDTALHRALGFDHRGRVDVAVSPDQPQGVWLRQFLENLHVPYYAFRTAIMGSATAPHIHIGPGSTRVRAVNYVRPQYRTRYPISGGQ